MDTRFEILNEAGAVVASVVVTADDIAEARADYPSTWTDENIAADIYEQRFESALAKVGIGYDEARNFTARLVTSRPRVTPFDTHGR